MTQLSRKIHFSAGHRYFTSKLSEEENKEIFGACYTPYGHGHNYTLEVTLEGQIDPITGMVINLVDVDQALKEVVGPLDHKHLNFDIPEFKETVPTTENVAKYCFDKLTPLFNNNVKVIRTRVYEASDLWADFYGE